MRDIGKQTHGAHQGECADVGMGQCFMESNGRRQNRAATRDHIIYEKNACRRLARVRHRQ
jgi:hypothetical protein